VKRALLVVLVVGALAVSAWSKYKSVRAELVGQREAIDAEWSQVELTLERRAQVALRIAPASGELRQASATLSAAASPHEKIQANTRISELLADVPKTDRANEQRLLDSENRIDVERRRYNEMLEHYNAQIQKFPENVVASLAGFQRDDAYLPTPAGRRP